MSERLLRCARRAAEWLHSRLASSLPIAARVGVGDTAAMRRSFTLTDRLRYRFDNFMSRGPLALVGALALASALVVLLGATLVYALDVAPESAEKPKPNLAALIWMSAMRAMDAGTLGGDDGGSLYLGLMLLVTLGGIFVVSSLIGVLTSSLGQKLEDLRKGRSRVVETGHVLVLGWSGHIHTVISELCAAAESARGTVIVVVADQDKVEMEDAIRTKVPDTRRSRVVVRRGSPIDLDDLDLGSPETARAIVVLGPEGTSDPDASVIKTLLALVGHKPREHGKHHIVAEIRDPKNRIPAKMVGRDQVELVVTSDVIARIAVQTSRQAGLSAVYADLLDFGGDEIYFHAAPSLVGKTFAEALLAFEHSAVIGIQGPDGATRLLPPMEQVLGAQDSLIVVAADEDRIKVTERKSVSATLELPPSSPSSNQPERTLILGWNGRGTTVVAELDKYAAAGSELTIVADDEAPELALAELDGALVHHQVKVLRGDIADRRVLDSLDVRRYQHIITLSYADKLGVQEADAVTLVTLLHLRDIEERFGESFSVVSEMLDVRNQKLAEVTKTDDFIVSDNLVSLLLVQLSENKALGGVFEDLFDADGAEIYLKPAERFLALGQSTDFYAVVELARQRGELAIGYHRAQAEPGKSLVLNPVKSQPVTFAPGDRVIVLANS